MGNFLCCHRFSEEKTEKHQLEEGEFSGLDYYSFEGQTHLAKVVRVIDADTIVIVFFVRKEPCKYILRLYGFDAPEKKPRKDSPNCQLEKKAALVSTEILTSLLVCSKNIVTVRFHKAEKYGRQLGEVFIQTKRVQELNIQKWMTDHQLVKPYFGKKKQEWKTSELQAMIDNREKFLFECQQLTK